MKIVNFLKALKPLIIVLVAEFLVLFLASIVYSLFFTSMNLEKFLLDFVNPFMVIVNLGLIYYFSKSLPIDKKKLPLYSYFPLIYLGISFALFLNLIIIKITGGNVPSNLNIFLLIIGTGIVGPILEEIVFRGLILDKFKQIFSRIVAIILNVVVFSIVHGNLVEIIYALIMGLLFVLVYEKYQNIKAPILLHMAANLSVIFLSSFNTSILFLAVIGVLLSSYLVFLKQI